MIKLHNRAFINPMNVIYLTTNKDTSYPCLVFLMFNNRGHSVRVEADELQSKFDEYGKMLDTFIPLMRMNGHYINTDAITSIAVENNTNIVANLLHERQVTLFASTNVDELHERIGEIAQTIDRISKEFGR